MAMTTADIEQAAGAAYAAYWRGQWPLPYRAAEWHVKYRWERLAAKWLNGELLTAQECREVYMEGYAPWEWENVAPKFRARWQAVREVLRQFRPMEVAA